MNPAGRPMDPVREAYVLRFGVDLYQASRLLDNALLCQLSECKSDEARRLILGKSER